jgi:tetratricopeptide (TPR) repeat protein
LKLDPLKLGSMSMINITLPICRTPVTSKITTTGSRYLRLIFALCLAGVANAGCAKDEPTKDELLSRAEAAFAAGQWDKAEMDYRKVLSLAPEDQAALRQLGIIYVDQGQIVQGYPLLKKFVDLQPDDPEIQLKLAAVYLSGRDYTQARDAASQILEKQPDNQQALLVLADASRSPDDIADARKRIQSLREKGQDRASYHVALASLDLRQNELTRAESELKTAVNLDPKSIEAHTALAALYWSRNDIKEAGQAFKTAVELSPPRSPVRLRYVDFLLRTGANADAKNILEETNQKFPDYLPPRVVLMKMACAERQDDACVARVKNVLAQDSINYDALYQDGILNLSKGDAIGAIRDFEYLSNAYRQNPLVRYQLARAYLLYSASKDANEATRRNAVEAAESRLNEAVSLEPRFDQAAVLLAELKLRKGIPAAAVELLEPLTKERPQIAQAQFAQAQYLLATAYLAQRKSDQALAVYRQMTELFPKDPRPSFLIGSVLLGQGKQADARKAFEKANEISPDYLPAVEKLVDLDLADKQYAAAMDRVQKVIDKDPKLASPWGLRAKIYVAQQDFAHAEPDLLKAIELDPKLEPAYQLLAQLYVASNRQEEAIAKLTAFVENNKGASAAPALLQLATIQEQLKHFDAARDAYEKLLTVAPNTPFALNNLAVLYSEHFGQLDKAYDLATKAKEAANSPHIADTLGWILFKRSDYNGALPLLQESAAKLPNIPEIQFHLGMTYYMLGEEGPARDALQKAVDAPADFRAKDQARRRLALLAIPAGTANETVRTELENYLRESPNDPVALTRLAEVQQREGAVDQAVKTYEKVVADNPSYGPATRQLALLYGRLSTDSAKAYELVTKAHQAFPDDAVIAKTLGILSYRRGFYPQSVELLKEAAAKRKDDAEVLYYLGEVHRQLKQFTECKSELERALTLNLSPGLANDAKGALAECSESSPQ